MPFAANIGFLMSPSVTNEYIQETCSRLARSGINSVRIVIDDAWEIGDSANSLENPDGSLKETILSRLDFLLSQTEKNGLPVFLTLFDIQNVSQNWETHPANRVNGGNCANMVDYLTKPGQIKRFMNRVEQLVNRYKSRNILAWELGRGVNIWEEEIPYNFDLVEPVRFWIVRILDKVRRLDDQNHLIALSFLPNTLPYSLMQIPAIQVLLLHVRSGKPSLAASSTHTFIQNVRKFKKPVFVGEYTWSGSSNSKKEEFIKNMIWSTAASNSSAFLMPETGKEIPHFSDAGLHHITSLRRFMEDVDIEGIPRPPSKAPIQLSPEESNLIVDSLVGNDWLFWILHKNQGEDQVNLMINTVEGMYNYIWFDTTLATPISTRDFKLPRKQLFLQTPPFEHDIMGRLRMKKRLKAEEEKTKGK